MGAELRALQGCSDAKRYLLWDRIRKGCKKLKEAITPALADFAKRAAPVVATLGGATRALGLVTKKAASVAAVAEEAKTVSFAEPAAVAVGAAVEFSVIAGGRVEHRGDDAGGRLGRGDRRGIVQIAATTRDRRRRGDDAGSSTSRRPTRDRRRRGDRRTDRRIARR